jgi:hypothetical protein
MFIKYLILIIGPKQGSGWIDENINQINQGFEKISYSIQSKLGVLIFN